MTSNRQDDRIHGHRSSIYCHSARATRSLQGCLTGSQPISTPHAGLDDVGGGATAAPVGLDELNSHHLDEDTRAPRPAPVCLPPFSFYSWGTRRPSGITLVDVNVTDGPLESNQPDDDDETPAVEHMLKGYQRFREGTSDG
jgi:hypothetical protein